MSPPAEPPSSLSRRVPSGSEETNPTGITTTGSERARDIGVLRAQYHGASKSDNTWHIMRLYEGTANGSPDLEPPKGSKPLTVYEKTECKLSSIHKKPAFRSMDRTAAAPLSVNPSPQSVILFNKAVDRIMVYENHANAASTQRLMYDFNLCIEVAGTMHDIYITFLHDAFNLETRERIVALYRSVEEDFFAAWAELEVTSSFHNPVFPMEQGSTHPASPVPAWLEKRASKYAA